MMYTEKAALRILCCGPENCGTSQSEDGRIIPLGIRVCSGRSCAAFRWKVTLAFTNKAEASYRRSGARLKPEPEDVIGYCGLAGPPLDTSLIRGVDV